MHNQTYATFDKLLRIDTRDYPETAVREALLNLLVHRDYSFSASALISIYSDRIEFVSVGGLLPGIDLDDIMVGLSVCRNQNLANVFYRLQLIEAYGTGMRKIMNAYEEQSQKPIIENTSNAFKITLPNINAMHDTVNTTDTSPALILSEDEKKVLEFARNHGAVTRAEAEALLGTSTSTAARLLRRMVTENVLTQHGKGRGITYIPTI